MAQWKNQFNTTTFQAFMTKFFADSLIRKSFEGTQIFNKKLIVPLTKDKNAEIILSTKNIAGQYEGFKVIITHKTNGEISRQWFGFREYLSNGTDSKKYPHIIEHCDTDWYMDGATHNSIGQLDGQIFDYINFYK